MGLERIIRSLALAFMVGFVGCGRHDREENSRRKNAIAVWNIDEKKYVQDVDEKEYFSWEEGRKAYDVRAEVVDITGEKHFLNRCFTKGSVYMDEAFLLGRIFSDRTISTTHFDNWLTSESHGNYDGLTYILSKSYNLADFTLTLLKEDSGIKRFFWLPNIRRIMRNSSSEGTTFYLTDGREFSGIWIPNARWECIYGSRDENLYYNTAYLYGRDESTLKKINIKNILSVEFQISEKAANIFNTSYKIIFSEKYPKKIILNSGDVIESGFSWLNDYCGHWHSTFCHSRLFNNVNVSNEKGERVVDIPLEKISEIEFLKCTTDVLELPSNEIIVRYKDGKEEKKNLYLTDESYGGVCKYSVTNWTDSIITMNDYGGMIIPLQYVKKVLPIHRQ